MDDYNIDQSQDSKDPSSYNGKIMLASGAVLVLACIIVVLFHAFGRWPRRNSNNHSHPQPHRRLHRSQTRRRHVILIPGAPDGGLDLRVLKSIPTFTYEAKPHEAPLECVVCLSEFGDGETGRVLPECGHRFHVGCIDMWLGTHRDCPLCRAQVRTDQAKDSFDDEESVIVQIDDDGGRGDEAGRDPGSRVDRDRSSSASSSHDRTVDIEQDHHHPMKTEGQVSVNSVVRLGIESGVKEVV